jgi:hypothetical protein
LFVTRSRDSGAIQEVAPTRTKVITVASPPKTRAFPPGAATMAGMGFLAGLALGLAAAFAREGRKGLAIPAPPVAAAPAPVVPVPEPAPAPAAQTAAEAPESPRGPMKFVVGAKGRFVTRASPQTLASLDLAGLGFRTLTANGDISEFREVLEALRQGRKSRRVIALTGANEDGERSALAINLALAAARSGAKVALIDAAGRNAKITRAVRLAARRPVLDEGVAYETVNKVRLLLPKAGDAGRGRVKPLTLLLQLIDASGLDWIFCDGPDAGEVGAGEFFAHTDAVVALEDPTTAAKLEELEVTPAAYISFAALEMRELRRA